MIPRTEVAYKIKNEKQKEQALWKGESKLQKYHITRFKFSLFKHKQKNHKTYKKQEVWSSQIKK